MFLQAGTNLCNSRNVQLVVGAFSRNDLGRQRHPQGIQGRHHHLELGQIGPVIFALPKLKQPLFCHRPIATSRGTIHAHSLGLQIIHSKRAPVQIGLERSPVFILRQLIQHNPQPVVTPFQPSHRLAGADFQDVQPLFCPELNLVEAVIAFRQDMTQPHQASPPQTGPLPVAMRPKMLVQKLWNPYLLALCQQYRDIVHLFRRYIQILCHADSLPHFSNPVKI